MKIYITEIVIFYKNDYICSVFALLRCYIHCTRNQDRSICVDVIVYFGQFTTDILQVKCSNSTFQGFLRGAIQSDPQCIEDMSKQNCTIRL